MRQRIAHITDVHWMEPPTVRQLPFKRILGTANLYGFNRRKHFSEKTQGALMRHLEALAPDALLFSGDLTAQATDKEFRKAFSALSPVMHTVPTFIVAGNHDVYTVGAHRSRRIEQHFSQWMHWSGDIQVSDSPERHLVGLHASRPHLYLASGVIPQAQLSALETHLSQDPAEGKPLVLVLHYPILDRHGEVYDGKGHGLLNARSLIDVLDRVSRKPDLIIHGHVHHGYTTTLDVSGHKIPIHNCGASGYSYLPEQNRTAHMNVYHFQENRMVECERFAFNGQTFEPEQGGPYAPSDETVQHQLEVLPEGTESHYVSLPNRTQMHWFECGSGDPVLLIHGFPSLPATFASLAEKLARTHRVIMPHLRGYGPTQSEATSIQSFRVEYVSNDLSQLLLHLDVNDVHVVGHDWGAAIAWQLVLQQAQGRVADLSILNAILPPRYFFHRMIMTGQIVRSWYMILFQIPWFPEWLLRRIGVRGFEALLRYSTTESTEELLSEAALAHKIVLEPDFGGVHYYRAAARRKLPPEQLLRTPAQIIYGLDDPALGAHLVSPSLTRSWAPHIKLHPLKNVGHWPHLESPNQVHQQLLRFWAERHMTQHRQRALASIELNTLQEELAGLGFPKFRAKQIYQWVHQNGVLDPDEMTNLPLDLRQVLKTHFRAMSLNIVDEQVSSDGTIKRLYALSDGQKIESVLMPYHSVRRTACISSQAGCAMGCTFCATGQMGFSRHLTADEIFEQAAVYAAHLRAQGERLSNVVLMGMGEPFHNYANVLAAIRRIISELGIGARHITVSTVGLATKIRAFADEGLQVTLAISHHAASDEIRGKMLPINRKHSIEDVMNACDYYVAQTNRRVTYEWALIEGKNDDQRTARQLGHLLKGRLCHVNLIPLNPTGGYDGGPTGQEAAAEFVDVLSEYGVSATLRVRRGIDIDAGCGQLKAKNQKV